MKAVLLAGGEGKGLRPVTCTTPGAMVKILGKPVIGYAIDLLLSYGADEIAVTVRYKSEETENYIASLDNTKAKIYCVEDGSVLGTAGSVRNAAKDWDEPFVVFSCDCISDIDLSKVMLYHKSIMADVTIVCNAVKEPGEYTTVCLTRNGSVDSFCINPDWCHCVSENADTGIYIMNPAVLSYIPDNVQYDFMLHLFPELLNEGKRLFGYQSTAYWSDIGNFRNLRSCIKDLMNHKTEISLPESRNGIFCSDRMPKGDYSVIPPVYFGKNVKVGINSVIGPYTVLEDNCEVSDNTRIKKSVIGSNTSIGQNCDIIGSICADNCVIKNNNVCLEGSCIGNGCVINSGSTVSNNVCVWPEKQIPHRSVLSSDLRDGQTEYMLLEDAAITGKTFSELSCERCCRIGEALGSSSCGSKVGIGYDSSKASKALAMAVMSGLISSGSVISDFGECFESQMGFFVSFCSLDSGIYITATEKKASVKLIGEYGLPVSRKHEREIESRYKRSDFIRNCGSELKEIHDMSSMSQVYEGHLLSCAGEGLKNVCVRIVSPNPMIESAADRCFFYLGCNSCDRPSFTVDYTGRNVSATDENGCFVPFEKLMILCARHELSKGNDICVPFEAPVCLDKEAEKYSANVLRVGNSPMREFSENAVTAARKNLWAFDGLSLVLKTAGLISAENKPLSQLIKELPEVYFVTRTVASEIPAGRIAGVLEICADNNSQGLRKNYSDDSITITTAGAGRLVRLIAEAGTIEAAQEICADTEKKITTHAIDIYHQ